MPDAPIVPHLQVPIRFQNGRAVLVEQDSPEEIEQCVEAVLRCPLGYRLELPEFGVADHAFEEQPVDTEDIQAAITTWEPRADVLIEEHPDLLDELIDHVQVSVDG